MHPLSQNKLMTHYTVGPGGSLNSLDLLFFSDVNDVGSLIKNDGYRKVIFNRVQDFDIIMLQKIN